METAQHSCTIFDSTLVSNFIGLFGEIVNGASCFADAAKAYELHALLSPLLSAHTSYRSFSIVGQVSSQASKDRSREPGQ